MELTEDEARQKKWTGDRRRMECSGCEVPQACVWIQDCAKWQREQQEKEGKQ